MKLEDVLTVLVHAPDYQLDVAELALDLVLASNMPVVSCCCCCCCI
jgi:hypothetical protein